MTASFDRTSDERPQESAMGASCKKTSGGPVAQRWSTSISHNSDTRRIDSGCFVDDLFVVQDEARNEDEFWIADAVGIDVHAKNAEDESTVHTYDASGSDSLRVKHHSCRHGQVTNGRSQGKLKRKVLQQILEG